jgi:hypothetical protein
MNHSKQVTATAGASGDASASAHEPKADSDMTSRSRRSSPASGGKMPTGRTMVGDGDHRIDLVLLVPVGIAASLIVMGQWLASTPITYLVAYALAVAGGLGVVVWYRSLLFRRRHR